MLDVTRRRLLCTVARASAALLPGVAWGRSFLEQSKLTYIVATKPGGGYDTYARMIAAAMEEVRPGLKIQIKNVPGAGNIVGANELYIARPDGFTIGTFNTGLIYAQLLGLPGVRFDLARFSWIGKAASDLRVLAVSAKSGIQSLQQLRQATEPVLLGSSGVGSASHNETLLLARALGLRIRILPGLAGKDDQLAMLRGDIAGAVGSHSSLLPFVNNGYGRFLVRAGSGDASTQAIASASDHVVDDVGRSIIALIDAMSDLGRLTAAPPGVAADRLAELRATYDEALRQPKLLETAAKLKLPLAPLTGSAVAKLVRTALNPKPEVLALLKEAAGPNPTLD